MVGSSPITHPTKKLPCGFQPRLSANEKAQVQGAQVQRSEACLSHAAATRNATQRSGFGQNDPPNISGPSWPKTQGLRREAVVILPRAPRNAADSARLALKYAPVAQLDRAPDFESVGRRFESCRAYQKTKAGTGASMLRCLLYFGPQAWDPVRRISESKVPPQAGFESASGVPLLPSQSGISQIQSFRVRRAYQNQKQAPAHFAAACFLSETESPSTL